MLDGLDQSDFIRSNVADTFTGTLTGQKGNAATILEFTNTATTNELHLRTYTSDYIGFRPAPAGVGAGTKDFFYNFTSSRWQFDESPYIGTDPIAALVSPAFTGNPTAPTPSTADNDTSIATTAFVTTANTNSEYTAKAWVNFNGTGTVAIRDSLNVSSITDLGIGDYQINFTTAMANTNYAVVGSMSGPDKRNSNITEDLLTTSFRFITTTNNVGDQDHDVASAVIFGGQ